MRLFFLCLTFFVSYLLPLHYQVFLRKHCFHFGLYLNSFDYFAVIHVCPPNIYRPPTHSWTESNLSCFPSQRSCVLPLCFGEITCPTHNTQNTPSIGESKPALEILLLGHCVPRPGHTERNLLWTVEGLRGVVLCRGSTTQHGDVLKICI